MAYPTVSGPYGLEPINLVGGQVFAGQTRLFPIASGSTTAIYYGDVVALNTSGTLDKVATTATAANAVGVFLGCTYTSPVTNQKLNAQYYPGAVVASDIQAYVQDDYDQLYKVAVVSSGTTIGGLTQAAVGQNVSLVQNAGSTITGDSKVAVLSTTGTATSLPFRVVAGIPETVNASGSYTEVVVKFNFGIHTYTNPAAVA